MVEKEFPTQEERSRFFSQIPTLTENEVFGEKRIVGLYSSDFTMVIAANDSELIKAKYELTEGEFVQVGLEKASWNGETWSEDLFAVREHE